LASNQSCDAKDLLNTALDILAQSPGVYVNENLVLTRFPGYRTYFPAYSEHGASLWFARSTNTSIRGNGEIVVVASKGVKDGDRKKLLQLVLENQPASGTDVADGGRCVTMNDFNTPTGKWRRLT
jgi:hypothetical protein